MSTHPTLTGPNDGFWVTDYEGRRVIGTVEPSDYDPEGLDFTFINPEPNRFSQVYEGLALDRIERPDSVELYDGLRYAERRRFEAEQALLRAEGELSNVQVDVAMLEDAYAKYEDDALGRNRPFTDSVTGHSDGTDWIGNPLSCTTCGEEIYHGAYGWTHSAAPDGTNPHHATTKEA